MGTTRRFGLSLAAVLVASAGAFAQTVIISSDIDDPIQGGGMGEIGIVVNGSELDGTVLGGGRTSLGIRKDDLPRYAKLLGLNADQIAAANTLFDAAQASFIEKSDASKKKIDAIKAEAKDQDEELGGYRRMSPIWAELSKQRQEIENAFLGDLRSLLTKEQEPRWSKVEMLRTRERLSKGMGLIAGERVDLLKVIEGMNLSESKLVAIEQARDSYEIALDRALNNRARVSKESTEKRMELLRKRDLDGVKALQNAEYDARVAVRDVNRQFIERFKSELGPDAARFEMGVKRSMFPGIYRERHVTKALSAAMELDGLSDTQRKGIAALQESFANDSAIINKKLEEAALKQEEDSIKGQRIEGGPDDGGGVRMMVSRTAGDDQAGRDLRTQRRKMDESTMNSLEQLLSPEQRAKLPPKPGAEAEPPVRRIIGGPSR